MVSPQNDNVLFAQSRNVRLTAPSLGDARRTTTDDTSRTGPPGGPEEGEEEADVHRRRQPRWWRAVGGDSPRTARSVRIPKGRRGRSCHGRCTGNLADAGRGVLSQETRHRGESGDGAAMDDGGQAVRSEEHTSELQ